jgi:thymidylate kinase
MWIILEGADGSGKSTLSRELLKHVHKSRIVHLGPPKSPETALDECLRGEDDVIAKYRPGAAYSQSLICDRLHWGSPVYGPIFRPESDINGWGDLGPDGWQYVEMFVAARGGITVMIDVDAQVAIERLNARGDDYVSAEHLEPIIESYRSLVSESLTLASIFRMTHQSDTFNAAKLITERARLHSQYAARSLFQFPGYVGAQHVEIVIAGPPSRGWRLQVLRDLPPGVWKRIGFCQNMATEELHALAATVSPRASLTEKLKPQAKVFNYRPTKVHAEGPWPIVHEHDALMSMIREATA